MEFEHYDTKGAKAEQTLTGICLNLGGEHDPQKDTYSIRGVRVEYDGRMEQITADTSNLNEEQQAVIKRLRSHFPYRTVNTKPGNLADILEI